jgi:hypothetical protein
MADLQAKADPTSTAAELPPKEEVVAGSQEASSTNPSEINWETLDDVAYQKLAADAVANQHQTGETAEVVPPVEKAPAGEETQEEKTEREATEAAAAAKAAADAAAVAEDEVAPVQGKYRPRLDALPEIEKESIALRKQLAASGQNVSLKDCIGRVEAKYGIVDGKAPESNAAPELPTSASIRENITALRTQFKEAASAVDTVKMAETQGQIEDARDALLDATQRESQADTSRQTEAQRATAIKNAAITQSIAKARADFPELADEKSPIAKQWHVVYQRMKAEGDPTVNSPNASYLISVIAGAEIGVTAKKAASSNANPPNRSVQPAPGSLRSSAGTIKPGQLDSEINAAQSQEDYDKLLQKAGIS